MNTLALSECKKVKTSFKTKSENCNNTYDVRADQRDESLVSDFELGYQLQTADSIEWQRSNQIFLNAFSQYRTKKSYEPANCSMVSKSRYKRLFE